MIALTEQQQQALQAHPGEPPRVFNPATNETFVLLPAAAYERIKALLEEEGPDMRQVAALVERAMREEDAGDPALESYQKYRNPS